MRPSRDHAIPPRMPRFFFHTHDGEEITDREGLELPSAAEARQEAARLLGELLRDRPDAFWERGVITVTVEAERRTLFSLRAATS